MPHASPGRREYYTENLPRFSDFLTLIFRIDDSSPPIPSSMESERPAEDVLRSSRGGDVLSGRRSRRTQPQATRSKTIRPRAAESQFNGLRVLTLESRRADLVEKLVREEGGESFNASSVREIPLEQNQECRQLARDLIGDHYDALVLTTGVGVQCLIDVAATMDLKDPLLSALERVCIVSRGPKPAAVLRNYGQRAKISVPEPNTWREVADSMRGLPAHTVAVQAYGVSNPQLVTLLEERGFLVTEVPVYRWTLPEDVEPLEQAARRIAGGECDIVLFLSSVQMVHLLDTAERLHLREQVIERLRREVVVASIGPVMTDALAKEGLEPDFIPKHPKLAICIRQLSEQSKALVERKRRGAG